LLSATKLELTVLLFLLQSSGTGSLAERLRTPDDAKDELDEPEAVEERWWAIGEIAPNRCALKPPA